MRQKHATPAATAALGLLAAGCVGTSGAATRTTLLSTRLAQGEQRTIELPYTGRQVGERRRCATAALRHPAPHRAAAARGAPPGRRPWPQPRAHRQR